MSELYVECDDGCGYIGSDFITDYNSSEGKIALAKRGFNPSIPEGLSQLQTWFSGYICPSCGKFDSVQVLSGYKPENGLEKQDPN